MLNTNLEKYLNQYKGRGRTKILKKYKTKFKSIKIVMTLKEFKKIYIRDFYNSKSLKQLQKTFNIDKKTLNLALMKRSLLNKIVTRRYYFLFFTKQFPNRFSRRKKKFGRRKLRKKNLKLRVQIFFRIPYDNFLFYLNILDKQLLIKPFNFCQSLYFFKMRKFRKAYIIRKKRQRQKLRRFKYVYRFRRRRRRRRRIGRRSRRPRYVKYRFKRKFFMKKLKERKLKKFKNFFKFISFFKTCKKATLKLDDYFKITSFLHRPYKLLKFNFNKVTNSYNFFLNFNSQRKQTINMSNTKNIFNQEKTKLYSIIKVKLKNRFILNNNNKIITTSNLSSDFFDIKEKTNINLPDYLCYKTLVKDEIRKEYKTNPLKNIIQIRNEKKKLFCLINVMNNIFKKILFFQTIIHKLKNINKKQLCSLFFNSFNIHNQIISKFTTNQKIINIILDIILKFKNKLIPLLINFSILYLKVNDLNMTKLKKKTNFFKKICFFFNKLKTISKKKKNKQNIFLSLFFFKDKYLSYKDKYFDSDVIKEDYNYSRKRWKQIKFEMKRKKKFKYSALRRLKKNFIISDFYLYKNYFSKKQLSKNYNYCNFGIKKFMFIYETFIKKSNKSNLINTQKKKNINFLH